MSEGELKKRIQEWWESDYSEELSIDEPTTRIGSFKTGTKSPFEIIDEAKKEMLKFGIKLELTATPTILASGYVAKNEKLIAIPESTWNKWFGDSS